MFQCDVGASGRTKSRRVRNRSIVLLHGMLKHVDCGDTEVSLVHCLSNLVEDSISSIQMNRSHISFPKCSLNKKKQQQQLKFQWQPNDTQKRWSLAFNLLYILLYFHPVGENGIISKVRELGRSNSFIHHITYVYYSAGSSTSSCKCTRPRLNFHFYQKTSYRFGKPTPSLYDQARERSMRAWIRLGINSFLSLIFWRLLV